MQQGAQRMPSLHEPVQDSNRTSSMAQTFDGGVPPTKRLMHRGLTSGREDDNLESIKKRFSKPFDNDYNADA